MNKISAKQITDAAKEHAKRVLGTQFNSNPDARVAIIEDFKTAVK